MGDNLLTLKEAAVIMRCSYETALTAAKKGEFPFRKRLGRWIIPRSVLYRELGLDDSFGQPEGDSESVRSKS